MTSLRVRPLGPDDREPLAAAFEALSPESRYQRFLGPKPRLSARELTALTDLDHLDRDALAAFEAGSGRLVAVARYAVHPDGHDRADIAVTVLDDWQGRGLGTMLARAIVHRAESSGIARLTATTFADNARCRALLGRLGFHPVGRDGAVIEFGLDLGRLTHGQEVAVA
jgi:RimJ/RimL family protein N-acetyltransferase